MTTISFSVEDEIKQDIARWAKRARKSKSDIFRDMAIVYKFNEQLDKFTDSTNKTLLELGIASEDELYKYLESNETYKDRIRQQHISGSNPKK
jgi:hypothetical protein